jgi:hypothetical protein
VSCQEVLINDDDDYNNDADDDGNNNEHDDYNDNNIYVIHVIYECRSSRIRRRKSLGRPASLPFIIALQFIIA